MSVRREKIKQAFAGENLDILINDENESVRVAVARQGYGLDILLKDENEWVREVAQEELDKLNKN